MTSSEPMDADGARDEWNRLILAGAAKRHNEVHQRLRRLVRDYHIPPDLVAAGTAAAKTLRGIGLPAADAASAGWQVMEALLAFPSCQNRELLAAALRIYLDAERSLPQAQGGQGR